MFTFCIYSCIYNDFKNVTGLLPSKRVLHYFYTNKKYINELSVLKIVGLHIRFVRVNNSDNYVTSRKYKGQNADNSITSRSRQTMAIDNFGTDKVTK